MPFKSKPADKIEESDIKPITTIEYEPGVIRDLQKAIEKIAP